MAWELGKQTHSRQLSGSGGHSLVADFCFIFWWPVPHDMNQSKWTSHTGQETWPPKLYNTWRAISVHTKKANNLAFNTTQTKLKKWMFHDYVLTLLSISRAGMIYIFESFSTLYSRGIHLWQSGKGCRYSKTLPPFARYLSNSRTWQHSQTGVLHLNLQPRWSEADAQDHKSGSHGRHRQCLQRLSTHTHVKVQNGSIAKPRC